MLFDDAGTQHIGHLKDLLMLSVVSRDVCLPIAFNARNGFSRRKIKMLMHHLSHVGGQEMSIQPESREVRHRQRSSFDDSCVPPFGDSPTSRGASKRELLRGTY